MPLLGGNVFCDIIHISLFNQKYIPVNLIQVDAKTKTAKLVEEHVE